MNPAAQNWPDYELIDFGGGRKLERFCELVCDRPCPAADERPRSRSWNANAVYQGAKVGDGQWKAARELRSSAGDVTVPLSGDRSFQMRLELSPAGQVGFFPEQFANWRWIAKQVTRATSATLSHSPSPKVGGGKLLRVLNLFAYTGGSTLAAAIAGAEVTHVDASKPSVTIARQNADTSELAEAPIRWIVEDAVKYCRRELKRGNRYDAVILDPPSYGHGLKGEEWKLARDLPVLLELCAELTQRTPAFFLATCHTPGVGQAELSAYLSDAVVGHCGQPPASGRLWLTTRDGHRLQSGVFARWPR